MPRRRERRAFGTVRLVMAAFGVFALVARLIYSLGFSGPVVANFVSYFTMESAFAAITFWAIGGFAAIRHHDDPPWLSTARLMATSYQIVSGVGFTLIVIEAGQHDYTMVVPFSSVALHYILPVYGILDWVVSPDRMHGAWRLLSTIVVYPLVWGAYTLSRGAVIGWYPYFFLDPVQVTVPEMTGYSVAALVLILVVATALIVIGRAMPASLRRLGGEP